MTEKLILPVRTTGYVYSLNLAILCYLFRSAIPFLKYPFIFFTLIVLVFILIYERKLLALSFICFLKNFYLLTILAFLIIIPFFLSDKLYLSIFKDISNVTILLAILFFLTLFIKTQKELIIWMTNFFQLLVFFAFFISIYELGNLLIIFPDSLKFSDYSVFGGSTIGLLSIDYNFSLLPIIFASIIIYNRLNKEYPVNKVIVLNLILILFYFTIFFSGSRRGLFILLVFFIFILSIQLRLFLPKNFKLRKLGENTRYLFPLLSIILLSLYLFFSNTTYKTKLHALEHAGSRNVILAANNISLKLLRYVTLVNNEVTYNDIFTKVWSPKTNPFDPDSGWGTRIHKTVYPLQGTNVEIVPDKAKGYFMDRNCNSHTWSGNSYSFTVIGKSNVTKGDSIKASVYCYVSNDFSGTNAYLYSEGNILGNRAALYNFDNLGTWQKLQLNLICEDGEAVVSVYFSKSGVTNFSTLEGYIIFAYPEFDVVKINRDTSGLKQSLRKEILSHSYVEKEYLTIIDTGIHGSKFYFSKLLLKHDDSDLKVCKLSFNKNDFIQFPNLSTLSFNPFYRTGLYYKDSMTVTQSDRDPIRRWISGLISEDTSYLAYKGNFQVNSTSDTFFSDRIFRWKFAWEVFSTEFTPVQKIFGGGYNYLNWYGYYFLNDKTKTDYPHNPFLSVLLYSGLLGLVLYVLLLYKVFLYYISYFKRFYILFLFFLITFFFSFFSAGNPFDPPVMGFFVIVPFFVNSVLEKYNS